MWTRVQLLLVIIVVMIVAPLPTSAQLSPPERTDEEIAGRSTDIFVGRIEAIVGYGIAQTNALASIGAIAQMDCAGPCVEYMTHYKVTVLEIIKG